MSTEHGVKSIMPKAAWELLESNPKAVLIDVRSEMEYLFVGHPKGCIHISWIDGPDWQRNPNFLSEVRKVLLGGVISDRENEEQTVESAPILIICRSGARSLDAGKLLVSEGFDNVYNVLEGFEGDLDSNHQRSTIGGWRFHKLPWEQC